MTAVTWRNRFFLPEEVSLHNTRNDCWVTIHGVVKDVSRLIAEYEDPKDLVPILREAGQDVSYWFDVDENGAPVIKTRLDPETGARVSALPFRIPHQPNFYPDVDWMPPDPDVKPWWQDEKYNVGMESVRAINVRVMNPLLKLSVTIKVCLEDTVGRILERYSAYNPEIYNYSVGYIGKPLRMDWNLSQNGVMLKHDEDVEDYVPTLMIYYKRNSTV